jgi:hypothetical protein
MFEAPAVVLGLPARVHSTLLQLKAKLLERGYELDDVRAALDRLESVGLQVL